MNLWRVFAGGLLIIFMSSSFAHPTSLNSTLTAIFEVGLSYDDNILHYSSQDIDDFVNNRRTYRYEIETYDDLVIRNSVALYWRNKILKDRTRLRIKYTQQVYTINPIKDYQTVSFHLRQSWEKNQFQVGYLYIPRFYIRHLPELDLEPNGHTQYEVCDFEKQQFSVKLSRNLFSGTSLDLWYRYGIYDYNPNFNEYDTKTHLFQFTFGALINPIRITAGYSYKLSIARGYDAEGESKQTSDDPDISYNEDGVRGELRVDLSPPITVALGYNYQRKYFITEKSFTEDPYHFDRKDWYLELSPSIGFELSPNLEVQLEYTYKRRDTHSPVKPEIEEVKDYTNNRFEIRVIGGTKL